MKGIFREASNDGDNPNIFDDENVDCPDVDNSSVKIQVKACGLSLANGKILNEVHRKNPTSRYPVGQEIAGIVIETGTNVTVVKPGDRVVGMLPVDSSCSGCSEFCVVNEYDVVCLPEEVDFTNAAASIGEGLKAYSALHYLARVCSGDTVLIIDGASAFGTLAIQLAQNWGAKVLATSSSDEEKEYLENIEPKLAQVIELNGKNNMLLSSVMEETGGLGVDCVIDAGVKQFSSDEDSNILVDDLRYPLPSKHEIILSLAVGGRWVTTQYDLQLDPPSSQLLFMKGASVCFLCEYAWMLSQAQQGRYQHILNDILGRLKNETLRPHIAKTISFDRTVETLKNLKDVRIGKAVTLL